MPYKDPDRQREYARRWWHERRGRTQREGDRTIPRNAKITLDDARLIRRLLAEGERTRDVAEQFGLHRSQVWRIRIGRIWPEP